MGGKLLWVCLSVPNIVVVIIIRQVMPPKALRAAAAVEEPDQLQVSSEAYSIVSYSMS